jgi:hypothetical protein
MKKLVSIVLLGLAVGTVGVFAAPKKKDTTDYKKLWEAEKESSAQAGKDAQCDAYEEAKNSSNQAVSGWGSAKYDENCD